jgi:methylase of polypeptide subunit release factors
MDGTLLPQIATETLSDFVKRCHAHSAPYMADVCGLPVTVLPEVFSPAYDDSSAAFYRAITALVAQGNITGQENKRVLDMGSGTGVYGVFAKKLFPNAKVVAVDINDAAVECTRINYRKHGVGSDVRCGHLFEAVRPDEQFDIITFNPPFGGGKPKTKLEYALKSNKNNIIRSFLCGAGNRLRDGGQVLMLSHASYAAMQANIESSAAKHGYRIAHRVNALGTTTMWQIDRLVRNELA